MTNPHYHAARSVRLYEAETSVSMAAARHGLDPAEVVDFSLNVNPFGPPASAMAAACEALEHAHKYPDVRLPALRAAVAARHDVAAGQVFFGAGLDDVIKLLLNAWTAEGDAVLVHLPTFPRYELEARLRGCEVVAVVGDPPWFVDAAGMERALAARPIALAFLCTPNNPTGESIPGDVVAGLAHAFPSTQFVVDEALLNPLEAGVWPHVRGLANVALLRTFSKYYGLAGFRVGYAIGSAERVATAEVGRPPFNVALPSEAAAMAVLHDFAFLRACFARFRDEAAYAQERLARLPAFRVRGRHANMLLIEVPGWPIAPLQQALEARGILVADAACFGGLGDRAAFRVSLRDRAANERLLDALERVA